MSKSISWKTVFSLLAIFLLYSTVPILAKVISQFDLNSGAFWLGLCSILGVLGVYALLWQQLLKRIPLSTAYMFRGSTLIFVLIFSVIFLGDTVTLFNCLGAVMIVIGMALFAKEI